MSKCGMYFHYVNMSLDVEHIQKRIDNIELYKKSIGDDYYDMSLKYWSKRLELAEEIKKEYEKMLEVVS